MLKQMQTGIKAGKADPATGVKGLMGISGKNDQYCLTEAPNAQAVHKYHDAMGIKLSGGDVVEVSTVS